MKRNLASIGCYGVIVLILLGTTAWLATTFRGRIILGIVLGIIGLLAIVCIPHNLRIRRVRKAFRNLPKEVKEQVLDLIEEAATKHPSMTYLLLDHEVPFSQPETSVVSEAAATKNPSISYLLLDHESPCSQHETVVLSHVGGVPYAERGETWPVHADSRPPRFLLQVRLDEPSLGEQWQDRLIAVFLDFDAEQIVRSYAAPSLEKYEPISSPVPPFGCIRLRSLRFPVASKDEPIPMSPAELCDSIPEITNLLSRFTGDCSALLSQIIRPNLYGYDLEAPEIAYQGGSPMLIQNPHDPQCDHCNRRMRFLFQFGEVIPGLTLADAGVGYVYGCDDHPDHCKAFIDSH